MLTADAYDRVTSLPRPLRVLMVSAELAPLARAGALGDVIQGLSRALGTMGVEIVVVTPLYGITSLEGVPVPEAWPKPLWVRLGGDVREVGVLETTLTGDVRALLLDCPPLFRRNGIYGDEHGEFGDNDVRFAVLSAAALEVAEAIWGGPPDILHAHDWHAALSIAYARHSSVEAWRKATSVFTFHNLTFQGLFPACRAGALGLPESLLHEDGALVGDCISLLKCGIAYADRVTTVSPTYASQALDPQVGGALQRVLVARSTQLVGITNGIDTDVWNPARDRALSARYDAHDPTGKRACKLSLAAELGLDMSAEAPLLGVVSRLVAQKGIDMLIDCLPALVDTGARLAIVAVGDADLQQRLEHAQKQWPGRVAFRALFGHPLSRRVYAGADMFVMPSRFEPCGLGQQYAMRYGAVPVVSAVGGLADTVAQVDESAATGTGFLFHDISADGLRAAVARALAAYENKTLWPRIVRNCLLRDASWDASARRYFALYRVLTGAPPRPSLPPPPAVG